MDGLGSYIEGLGSWGSDAVSCFLYHDMFSLYMYFLIRTTRYVRIKHGSHTSCMMEAV